MAVSKPKKNVFRKGLQYLSQPLLWRMYKWYLSKPRWYDYEGLRIRLYPSVFHPSWFLSTKVLLDYVRRNEVANKKVLELGAGSGLISISLARSGALVTATDINPLAIQAIQESVDENQLEITLIESDLFEKIPDAAYDYILVNPPYYPKKPTNPTEQAFFCGEDFDYFKRFFKEVQAYIKTSTQVLMILSEDCEIEHIQLMAKDASLEMQLDFKTSKMQEEQYIFRITSAEALKSQ